ncbi:pyruvate dehydrogenase (acetyl-transferring) E1 component subunit alpha [Salinibaculum salinum]|uniref:pyruvate dehydrogenase (acetyl-transferring) E1 component subunit alpha n=1 Tax=Salinibaculum salinum TaxID=3131996 RepID=UPI0030EF0058
MPTDLDDQAVQILTSDGTVRSDATVPDIADETLVGMYEGMVFARELDHRATTMHRQGRMGTYPPLAGQEAAQIASTLALADDDWISYQYREHGTAIARGISHEYLLYWMGHEAGNEWLPDRNIFPVNISIGSQLPHATGMAWAAKLSGDDTAVVCHFGDGATSEGDFHEALNFAGVFDVPAIYFCNNNQYAISIPRGCQTAATTIAQKADAYGLKGVQVDGMDPLAVYQVTREAVERAKNPPDEPDHDSGSARRPTLVEAVMYRLGAHTTVDDPSNYRDDEEVKHWRERDPIPRMETFLRDRDLLDEERVETIQEEVEDEIATLVEQAEAYEADPDDMFEYTYAEATPRIRAQQEAFREARERHADERFLQDEGE